jgi:hypothetical protein
MNTLIVTYELAPPGLNYEHLIKRIRTQPSWARLGAHAYLVKTDLTVVQLRDDLQQTLRNGDKLFVGNCPVPAAWHGQPEDVSKWILENQPR